MRALQRALWLLLLVALATLGVGPGCARDDRDYAWEETIGEPGPDQQPGPDQEPPIDTSGLGDECPGQCVAEPQAPFNARIHLMWFGPESLDHQCPRDAPLPGLVAQVLSVDMNGQPEPARSQWVRECLISNDADPCDEGLTCAIVPPDEDYELCISRELDGSCPTDYYPRHVRAQEQGEPLAAPLTLCCTHKKLR